MITRTWEFFILLFEARTEFSNVRGARRPHHESLEPKRQRSCAETNLLSLLPGAIDNHPLIYAYYIMLAHPRLRMTFEPVQ